MESEQRFNLQAKLNEEAVNYQHILEQTHLQALEQNSVQAARWEAYKTEHTELSSRLLTLRDKLSHEVMVPMGKKAFMKGNLVHTNELLVCLGDGWFAKQSAKEASDICMRRIENCDEMLKNLEKERDLLTSRKTFPIDNEVFGAGESQEIIEAYDEEEEKKWKERHRQKEKEYRQKLAELKKGNGKIETEEDLWKRLDALDLQEELEDELDRINESDEEENSEEDDDSEEESSDEGDTKDEKKCDPVNSKPTLKRRVSFKKELESEDGVEPSDDSMRITFKHSEAQFTPSPSESGINNPSDIYVEYMRTKVPHSILKPSPSVEHFPPSEEFREQFSLNSEFCEAVKHKTTISQNDTEPAVQAIGEVLERTVEPPTTVTNDKRPISRFKAARMAKK